ncbi:uncharacterized protein LOC135209108 isoform X2 [Macrobrachium nipponense]|uniref:uncharacterized protein LOC135209108 isoform X2 n=1 Tax=Macrobrachium nipponense TaxID=159736 RepID=UPI0030C88198
MSCDQESEQKPHSIPKCCSEIHYRCCSPGWKGQSVSVGMKIHQLASCWKGQSDYVTKCFSHKQLPTTNFLISCDMQLDDFHCGEQEMSLIIPNPMTYKLGASPVLVHLQNYFQKT